MNPFKYGSPVDGDFFVERKELKRTVMSFLTNQIHCVLIGPRRFGKTSFILDLHQEFKQLHYVTLYVDTFNVTGHRDFLQQLINAVSSKKNSAQRFFQGFLQVLKKTKPELSVDQSITLSTAFKVSVADHKLSDEEVKQLIIDTLHSLSDLGDRVCITFDEFQTIGNLDDKGWLEATLRSAIQMSKNVSYLFSGSRHGIIHDMFNNSARPFYRSCQLIDFPPLGPEFTQWIIERFNHVGIHSEPNVITHLRELVDDTPNYVQMVCFHIVASEIKQVDTHVIEATLDLITRQNSYPYQTILNSLTPVQRRVLRLAACERKTLFSKENLEKYEIKSGAHVSQALNTLIGKQILDAGTKKGRVVFDDPLFAIWVQKEFSGS